VSLTGQRGKLPRATRFPRMVAAIAIAVAALTLGAIARGDLADDAWKRGNDAYLRGDYASAVAAYEQLDRQDLISSELAYNLGNAYYRQGALGKAIWAWERALNLDPDADDARYNLGQARQAAERRVHDKIEGADRDPVWIRVVTELTLSTETWLFLALYLAFFVALGLRLRARRSAGRDDVSGWAAVAAVLGVAAALAGALLAGRVALDRVPFAVVLADAVPVKEGADPNYRTTFEVHAGLRVRLLDHDQDWVRIRLANGLEGWVHDRDVGRL
jgi:tetratricopeptide (TPR) repeat protein